MRKLFIILLTFFIFLTFYIIFIDNITFYNSLLDTLNIWLYKVLPSLFVFNILSSILINFKIIDFFYFLFTPLKKILKFETDEAFNIFITSIFNGNPSTILLINQRLDNNLITIKDANCLLKCASFLNPLFIYSFFSKKIALILIFSHILSNFIYATYINRNNKIISKNRESDLLFNIDLFFKSIEKVISVLLLIASLMLVTTIIKYTFNYLLSLININKSFYKIILSFIEISSGLSDLSSINIPVIYLIILSSFLTSFNGLCIHLQIKLFLSKNLSYTSFFYSRIVQGIISVLLSIIFYFI